MLSTWLSHRDCVHLVDVSLRAPGLHFEIIYGVSANMHLKPFSSVRL